MAAELTKVMSCSDRQGLAPSHASSCEPMFLPGYGPGTPEEPDTGQGREERGREGVNQCQKKQTNMSNHTCGEVTESCIICWTRTCVFSRTLSFASPRRSLIAGRTVYPHTKMNHKHTDTLTHTSNTYTRCFHKGEEEARKKAKKHRKN